MAFGPSFLVFLMALGMLGTPMLLFASICLDAFWTVFLGLSMDFIFFYFFFFLSTQGDI